MRTNDEIIAIVKELMNKLNLSNNELARRVGVAKSTMSRYLNKSREFPINEVGKFAKALHTTPEYILGFIEENTNDIVTIYNRLEQPRQQKVYDFAQHQLDEQNIDDTQSVYLVGHTAAGLAIDYGQFNIEKIKATVPKGADYAVLVHGDSMEPLIEDGQIIFYREQPIVENGEIAIVELNREEVTCKKFYHEGDKVILKSINPAYDDMVITENIRVIGKVII